MIHTFKEVAHLFLGCKLSDTSGKIWELFGIIKINDSFTCRLKSDKGLLTEMHIRFIKPILIPMDKMSEAEAAHLLIDIPIKDDHIQFDAEEFAYLLSRHYNVFNLPESEFIDATTLPVNPYLTP